MTELRAKALITIGLLLYFAGSELLSLPTEKRQWSYHTYFSMLGMIATSC